VLTNNPLTVITSAKSPKSCGRTRLKPRHKATLALGLPIIVVATAFHQQVLAGSLYVTLIAISFEHYLEKLAKKLNVKIKLWQVLVAIVVAAVFVSSAINPANAQLFNPLQQQTNTVLNAAGAGAAGASVTGIFTLMNIVVTIAGIGAVVYGAYNQNQGHSLRESFTPLALVLLVYIGCAFVMRMFLGA